MMCKLFACFLFIRLNAFVVVALVTFAVDLLGAVCSIGVTNCVASAGPH
jgi:hypothetical protein